MGLPLPHGNGPQFHPGLPLEHPSCQSPDLLSSLSRACSITGPGRLSGRQRPGQGALGPAPPYWGWGSWSPELRNEKVFFLLPADLLTWVSFPPSNPKSGPRLG